MRNRLLSIEIFHRGHIFVGETTCHLRYLRFVSTVILRVGAQQKEDRGKNTHRARKGQIHIARGHILYIVFRTVFLGLDTQCGWPPGWLCKTFGGH